MSGAQSPARIFLGVCGAISAYKAVHLARRLTQHGFAVKVGLTAAAAQFVAEGAFRVLTGNPTLSSIYGEENHIDLSKWADLVVVAPATANKLAKLRAGIADDVVTSMVLDTRAPVLLTPSMHTGMWENPATQDNVQVLQQRGYHFLGPVEGDLSSGDYGMGRMVEPEAIFAQVLTLLGKQDLRGRKLLITAGGTREALDPVRYLGNRSSGQQGLALAAQAARRGASVTLIAANMAVPDVAGLKVIKVTSAKDLEAALTAQWADFDTIIMAAAVADFRPEQVSDHKIKSGAEVTLRLLPNPDLLSLMSANKQPGQTIVGFAAETEPDSELRLELARQKLRRKGCDYLVLNQVGWDKGIDQPNNEVAVLDASAQVIKTVRGSKTDTADGILDILSSAVERE